MRSGRPDIWPVFFLFLLCAASARADMVVQACFSPLEKCSAHIVTEIGKARKEILVAVYAFTNDDLAWALVKAKERGLSVQVVLDREFDQENQKHSKGNFLERQTIAVRRVSGMKSAKHDRGLGLMHQKFAVIDRNVIFTGSYNWTHSADALNDENLLLFRDAGALGEEYRKAFFRIWERKR